MQAPTVELRDDIRACLREIKGPCSVATGHPLHLEEMGLVRSVEGDTGASRAIIDLRLTSPTWVMVGTSSPKSRSSFARWLRRSQASRSASTKGSSGRRT